MRFGIFTLALCALLIPVSFAYAAGKGKSPPEQDWSFTGITGTFDKAALQRGLKVYREVCAACHAMSRIRFRDLKALGYSEDQIKNIAASYTIGDGPDDEGLMFDRPGLPKDSFPSPFPNKKAAQAANNGAYPKDLSLIVKARKYGADYLYALLTGYKEAPAHFIEKNGELLPGQYYNEYMSGHIIAMAPPIMDGQISYEDGSPETVSQYSRDVSEFLAWASSPYMEKQKKTGLKVIIFLSVFAFIMYLVKRKIWADVKKKA